MLAGLVARRTQYEADINRVMDELQKKQVELQRSYVNDLEVLQRQLTQRGDLDGAVAVKAEREKTLAGLPQPPPPSPAPR